jgi:hypothetical protein
MKERLTIGKADIRKSIERWENEGGRVGSVREGWTLKPPSYDRHDELLSRYQGIQEFAPIESHYLVLDESRTP